MRWLYRWQRHIALTALETSVLLGIMGLLLLGLGVKQWQTRQIPPLADQLPAEAIVPDSLAAPNSPSPSSASLLAAPTPQININTANAEMLQTLSGIGPALSERIVAHREMHGPFASVDALQSVSGIGPKTVERLADRVVLSDAK